jgi:hypothetical protein
VRLCGGGARAALVLGTVVAEPLEEFSGSHNLDEQRDLVVEQVRVLSGDNGSLGELLLNTMSHYVPLLFKTLFPPTP